MCIRDRLVVEAVLLERVVMDQALKMVTQLVVMVVLDYYILLMEIVITMLVVVADHQIQLDVTTPQRVV